MDAVPGQVRSVKPISYKLRHRIDIQKRVETVNQQTGARSHAWVSVRSPGEAPIPAEIVPLSGREFVAAQSVQAGVTTRITIWNRGGLDASMRVIHRGQAYNIKAVLPDPTLARHMTLMCDTGVNDG